MDIKCSRCERRFAEDEEFTEYTGGGLGMRLCAKCQAEWDETGVLSFKPSEKEELEQERNGIVLRHVLKAIERMGATEGYEIPSFGHWLADIMEMQMFAEKSWAETFEEREFTKEEWIAGFTDRLDRALFEHRQKPDYQEIRKDAIRYAERSWETCK